MNIAFCGPSKCGKTTAGKFACDILGVPGPVNISDLLIEELAAIDGEPVDLVQADRDGAGGKEREDKARRELYIIGRAMERHDPLYWIRLALERSPIVCGIRTPEEVAAAREAKLFDAIVWVERPCTPNDPTCKMTAGECDRVIYNYGGKHELLWDIRRVVNYYRCKMKEKA